MFKTILLAFFIVTALTVRANVDNSVKHLEYRPEEKDWNTQDVRTGSGTQRVPSAAAPQAFPRYSEPIPYTPSSVKRPSSQNVPSSITVPLKRTQQDSESTDSEPDRPQTKQRKPKSLQQPKLAQSQSDRPQKAGSQAAGKGDQIALLLLEDLLRKGNQYEVNFEEKQVVKRSSQQAKREQEVLRQAGTLKKSDIEEEREEEIQKQQKKLTQTQIEELRAKETQRQWKELEQESRDKQAQRQWSQIEKQQTPKPTQTSSSTPTTTPTITPSTKFAEPPTTVLPDPTRGLTARGQSCVSKCREQGGIQCSDKSFTCCQFVGCQWPFFCAKDKVITVQGCAGNH